MTSQIVIESSAKGKKGRSFQATLLAYVVADSLWSEGQTDTDTIRPVWMMFAGTDGEIRPFVANMQSGRKAELVGNSSYSRRKATEFEILKSTGFHFSWQRTGLGSIVTAYLPDLFRLDPGMVDPEKVTFCMLPAADWVQLDESAKSHLVTLGVKGDQPELPLVLSLAPLFIAYLDRRTRCPLIPDKRFYAQVLYAALARGLASFGYNDRHYDDPFGHHRKLRYNEHDTEKVGLSKGIAFQSSHSDLETFLAEQVKLYDKATRG